ncbi:MAG: ribonuclease III [Clostridia bacterium]|nr:ribonuclease III [Clostridia bacterium]
MNYVKHISKITGHEFKNKSILRAALTHSSYANEKDRNCTYNERLEFLGDSVLSLVVSEFLYTQKRLAEGEMSKTRANLVCEKSLAECAKKMNLGDILFLGKGEERTGGRERASVLADATEALIAALYLDGGFEVAKEFVLSMLGDTMEKVLDKKYISDYKTALQEIIQANANEKIEYRLISESGPDHNKEFEMAVFLDNECFESGTGKTKKDAEQAAARLALIKMGKIDE